MTPYPSFTLGILQCDSVLPQFQSRFGNYPEMLSLLFSQIHPDINIRVYDVQHGDYPSYIHECDGYITTGSKASVYDNETWIKQLEAYIITLHQSRKKLIGICFGHQLIAQALGGNVRSAEQGWGVGVHTNLVASKAAWLAPYQNEFNLVVSHKDQVITLPGEASLVAYNDFCANAAFQVGEHFLTIQGHPEFPKDYAETLMKHRREILGEVCYQQGINSLTKHTDHLAFARWMMNFLCKT